MTGTPVNKIRSDIGGDPAGAIETHDHDMKFWEKQANGLRSVLSKKRLIAVDELRRAAEDLPNYSTLEYFERTTGALRTILTERGLITEDELQKKMAEIRKRFDVPNEMESPIKKAAKT
jgi:hypothetical protein